MCFGFRFLVSGFSGVCLCCLDFSSAIRFRLWFVFAFESLLAAAVSYSFDCGLLFSLGLGLLIPRGCLLDVVCWVVLYS